MFDSIEETLKYISESAVAMVDLKVADVSGRWRHITVPASRFSRAHLEEGVGFDGSAGSGFRKVEDGDLAARPAVRTAFIDPFYELRTLSFICDVVSADHKEPLASDPRTIAGKAVAYLKASGVADAALMAPEFEFHVLDRISVVEEPYRTMVEIESEEVHDGDSPPGNRSGQGYCSAPPTERLHNLRGEIVATLERVGLPVRYHHHEVGACGQCEVEVALADLLTAADRAMIVKYVVKNVAARHRKVATFMPKPVYGEAGNGMHVHQRLTKDNRPVFFDGRREAYANLSEAAIRYTIGLLLHGRALCGLTNASTNSYKRLVPNHEAPIKLFFSLANRSAAVRIPRYAISPDDKRIEYRPPDFTGNVYLSLAAMLMAGLDGVVSKVDVRDHHFGPFDLDIARQEETFVEKIASLPYTLEESLAALERDQAFLLAGKVFSRAFLQSWIDKHRRVDLTEVDRRPHPHEYTLYLDT